MLDRFEAMRIFVAVLDEGSMAAAARKLERSPAAVTRAIASLEQYVGASLFERSTRIIRLTEVGETYAAAARRILDEMEKINLAAGVEQVEPRGTLTLTAPVVAGAEVVAPVLDAYLDRYPHVETRFLLFDRTAHLLDEGIDVALRIAHLPDSSLIATRVGSVKRVICAAPSYLASHQPPAKPIDLAAHRIISMAETREADHWSFNDNERRGKTRLVHLSPRLRVNNVNAAKSSAVAGKGIARFLSYQVAAEIKAGTLATLLDAFEPVEVPVHLVAPKSRLAMPRVRAFLDFAVPRLKTAFAERSLS